MPSRLSRQLVFILVRLLSFLHASQRWFGRPAPLLFSLFADVLGFSEPEIVVAVKFQFGRFLVGRKIRAGARNDTNETDLSSRTQ